MKKLLRISGVTLCLLSIFLTHSCQKDSPPPKLSTITTTAISAITQISAVSGGNITSDGGASVTARGVCWSTTDNPTTTNSKTVEGTGTGQFVSNISGLTAGTTYHVRAYSTNSVGTTYGNDKEFKTIFPTDFDGNVYNTVTIGLQVWLKENLKTTKYRNGDLIETTTPATLDITNEIMPYQWPNGGDENNVATYGRLYTWYAATDNRGICPTGFHVPTDDEWKIFQDYLYENDYGCLVDNFVGIAKSMATKSGWLLSEEPCAVGNDQESNNTSGFTAVPSGYRVEYGHFNPNGYNADWWGVGSDEKPVIIGINFGSAYVGYASAHEIYGVSVRCIKDN